MHSAPVGAFSPVLPCPVWSGVQESVQLRPRVPCKFLNCLETILNPRQLASFAPNGDRTAPNLPTALDKQQGRVGLAQSVWLRHKLLSLHAESRASEEKATEPWLRNERVPPVKIRLDNDILPQVPTAAGNTTFRSASKCLSILAFVSVLST